jgi:hypothetical protein
VNNDNHENITEATIFVPATPRSSLKEALQKADDLFARAHGQPRIRFIERSGTTIMNELGKSDPWAGQWRCGRE